MDQKINIDDIEIRNYLKPGDLGLIIYLHGKLYNEEYDYGIVFESYVAEGLNEFYNTYDSDRSRVWVCEHQNKLIGFLLLMDRIDTAQLRYFLLVPEYRGIGLGNKLMKMFKDFLKKCKYKSSYLWTTHELTSATALYKKFGFKLIEEKQSTSFGKSLIEQKYELLL